MAISEFQFSKTWRDRTAFPTYQDDENQVREDMQVLHDELAAYVNTQIRPVVNDTADAVEDLVEGSVPDGSITTEKIHDGAVTEEKLDPAVLSGLTVGWEDVSSAITLAAQGSSVVEVAAKWYFYSRSLGIMVFFLQLYITVDANDSIALDQDGYPATLYLPSSPLSVHRRGCAAFLRSGYNGHDLRIQVSSQEALSNGTVCVSGWYFCGGSGEES